MHYGSRIIDVFEIQHACALISLPITPLSPTWSPYSPREDPLLPLSLIGDERTWHCRHTLFPLRVRCMNIMIRPLEMHLGGVTVWSLNEREEG